MYLYFGFYQVPRVLNPFRILLDYDNDSRSNNIHKKVSFECSIACQLIQDYSWLVTALRPKRIRGVKGNLKVLNFVGYLKIIMPNMTTHENILLLLRSLCWAWLYHMCQHLRVLLAWHFDYTTILSYLFTHVKRKINIYTCISIFYLYFYFKQVITQKIK